MKRIQTIRRIQTIWWNRLWVRLTLAFTLVILVAVGAIAILISRTTGTEFRQYITHSGMSASGSGIQRLATYYQENGNWEGVEDLLSEGIYVSRLGGMPMPGLGRHPGTMGWRLDVVLADAKGKVVFDNIFNRGERRL